MHYQVWLTNFDYALPGQFKTLHDSLRGGQKRGFEFAVYQVFTPTLMRLVLSWHPINGIEFYNVGELTKEMRDALSNG